MHMKTILAAALILVLGIFLAGCDSDDDPINAPEGHTVVQDGVAHAPGLGDPAANCTDCHGATLEGGDDTPSCFSCHGREW